MPASKARKYNGKRKENLKADMLATVATLNRRGYTQADIAKEVNLSQGQISYYLKQMRQVYLDTATEETKLYLEEKIEQFREIRLEAWREWERSKLPATRELERNTQRSYMTEQERIERLGDHRYLQVVFECLKEEMKIRGIVTGNGDGTGEGKGAYKPIDWAEFMQPTPDHVESRLRELEAQVDEMEPIILEAHNVKPVPVPHRNGDGSTASRNGDE